MFSLFKSKKGSQPLDQYLVRYLSGTYQMTDDQIGKLRFATTTESLASQKVTLFRIFDPAAANGSADSITYQGLDDHKSSLLFEGRFAMNNTVTEIRDLRATE